MSLLIKNTFLLTFLSLVLLGCRNTHSTEPPITYIGGEIINPIENYVILSKGNQLLDTVLLDSNNFFFYKADNLESGLYSFKNAEYQRFYLEPGDSLLLRVNTWEFDESLAFSGRGAEKNNFLMDLFLLNENEDIYVQKLFQYPPSAYARKLDSMRTDRMKLYNDILKKIDPSEEYKTLAQSNINYYYYAKKEQYVAANKNNPQLSSSHNYPKHFFDYRKHIDFDCEILRTTYPYYSFLKSYVDNLAYRKIQVKGGLDVNSFPYTYEKLIIIDSLVQSDSLKNDLLRTKTRMFLINAKNSEEDKKILDLFLKTSSNPNHRIEISQLAAAAVNLAGGSTIPSVQIFTPSHNKIDLQSIIKRPTVLYFWSSKSLKHERDVHLKVVELKSKYHEYDFVGINIDPSNPDWFETMKKSKYDAYMEYQLVNPREADKKLLLSSVSKIFILDKEGKILENNANMNNIGFEELLLGYLN